MKKILGMMVLLLALGTAGFAQKTEPAPDKNRKERAKSMQEARMKSMKKELNLTDEQAAQVSKLMQEQAKKQKALAEEMKANRETTKAELKSILTQEQYIQLLEKQVERGPRMRRQMRRRGGFERG